MSTHYSSNQFNSAFVPCRLQNFELPSNYKEFPSQRKGCTQPIANDRGHIVIYDRKSSTSPWGHFLGTWQKPRKPIKLQVTTKLMARGYSGGETPVTCPPTTNGTPISVSNSQVEESVSKEAQSPMPQPLSSGPSVEASKSPKGTRSGSPSSPPPGSSSQSTPSSSRCTSAHTNRNTCTPVGEKGSKQRISSAGHTPYSRQTLISPSSESNGSRPLSSSHSSIRSIPKPPSDRKPSSSGSSRAISSAPVIARSSGNLLSRQNDRQSLLGSSQSQRTCSRPESRQGTGQQSVMSQDDRTTYPSSYIESRPPSSQVSRPPSQASIALTSSTKSGIKSRGVQCSHT